MRYVPWAALLICGVLTGGCVITGQDMVARYGVDAQDPGELLICHDYGCAKRTPAGLSPQEWQAVRDVFVPAPESAAEERARAAEAVGLMEQFIGPQTGTADDGAKSAVFTFDARGQMDCLDESTNTTRYLTLMAHHGLLRFHTVGEIAYRGYMVDGVGPHNAATLIAPDGEVFAVDSWFHANGHAPEVAPVDSWKKGWVPPVYQEIPRPRGGDAHQP